MRNIKKFQDYINEGNTSTLLASMWNSVLGNLSAQQGTSGSSSTGGSSGFSSEDIPDSVPGNDDYLVYLQHQQGAAGVAGLVKAMKGTGKLHPDTVKTKKGTPYANLMGNIPSSVPASVKNSIKDDLDKGDQKSAATKFTNIWKEKFIKSYKDANREILNPKNKVVREAIASACIKTGVPFDFAVTVAYIESRFNPNAVSSNGVYKGLFQMAPNRNYGGEVGVLGSDWSDPEKNAEKGVKLIASDLKTFKKELGPTWSSLKMGDWTKNIA